jgi:hypothetical protein
VNERKQPQIIIIIIIIFKLARERKVERYYVLLISEEKGVDWLFLLRPKTSNKTNKQKTKKKTLSLLLLATPW